MTVTQDHIDRKVIPIHKPTYAFYRDKVNYQVVFGSENELRTKFGHRAFEEDFELTYKFFTEQDMFL